MATPDPIQALVRFSDYVVDLKAGELRKHGIRIKLQVQPFQVLQALLERPGQAITREELQKRIWPGDTFVDFDHGLNNAVKKLRAALGEEAENPRYIETLAKRGYRFIGALQSGSAATAGEIARDSIVVLPFLSLSGDPENEFFADGITEEIINALAQIKGLRVVARSSAFSFKGKTVDLRVVGERLNARTVLEGSVRRAENRLRITAQLINAADGYHFWSERYDREMKDIFDVQDEIARSIAERLKVTLEISGQGPLVKAGTRDLEAYEAFLKGRALLYQRNAGIPRALECFQMAVSLDPQYSLAWANIADAYVMLAFYGFLPPDRVLEKAKENATRAVTLDPAVAEGHNALAAATLLRDWDWAKAESEFVRALELDPRSGLARSRYALWCVLVAGGRFEEGIAQAQKASEFDPLSSYAATILAFAYFVAGEAAKALETARHAVQLEPESVLARISLAFALYLQGRYAEAVSATEMGLGMSGRHPMFMALLAVTLADCGKLSEAKLVHAELRARSAREYVSPFLLALSSAAIGGLEEATRFVQMAYETHDAQLTTFGKYWPGSKRLRDDCQFDKTLVAMGFG